MPTRKERLKPRKYKFCLRMFDAGQFKLECHTSTGRTISDAVHSLAKKLDADVDTISSIMEDYEDENPPTIWNPKGKKWVKPKPWWDEEKELYDWEK